MPFLITAARSLLCATAALSLVACKPASQKTKLGPFDVDRFEEKTADGQKLDCFLLGADSNKPVRICGNEGQPTPGFDGYFLNAQTPAPGGKFTESIGEPSAPGWYILRPQSSNRIDAWALGRLPFTFWLGGGKGLLGIETGSNHHTIVHLIDPTARSERQFDVGEMRADAWLLARAPNDASILLIQRRGGEEMILVRDPLGNQELGVGNSSDGKSPGNRRFFKRGDLMRQNGGQFIPSPADLANVTWKGDAPLYEGQLMGPFDPPASAK